MNILNFLDLNNVRYVVWKNSNLINDFFAGKENLDLLIDGNPEKVEEIFISNGWFELKSLTFNHNKIKHYYILYNGKLLHIHIYFELFTGDSIAKEFSFDKSKLFDNYFIDKTYKIKILNIDIQKYLFFLRVIIKNSSIFGNILFNRQKNLYLDEFIYLNNLNNNVSNIYNLPESLINKIHKYSIKNIYVPNYFQCIYYCYKIRKYKRFNFFKKNFILFLAIINNLINKKLFKKKQYLQNGKLICLIGPDGSGKSTLIDYISLKYNFIAIKRYNISKPYPKIIIKFIIFYKNSFLNVKKNKKFVKQKKRNSLFFLFKSIILSYLKFKISKKINKDLYKGHLVLCDRYISKNIGDINGPRIINSEGIIENFFSKIELYFYDLISNYNFQIKLDISLNNCLYRNQNRLKDVTKSDEEIKERYSLFYKSFFKSNVLFVLDNNISFELTKEKILDTVNKILCYNSTIGNS